MKKRVSVYFVVVFFALLSTASINTQKISESNISDQPVYLDTSYSFEERAADLVSRLTIEEKQSLLGNAMAAVPRLGINEYNVWGEALHGVVGVFNRNITTATSFPNSVALGAAWDPDLMEREAAAISDEARAANSPVVFNLTYWSPVVEPARDPRWGRTGESYSEDPFLISKIASGFIRGLMGDDPTYLKAVPTAKHYFANNTEFNRHVGSSDMDGRDMWEYYLAPYKYLIEKDDLPGIMTSYGAVNGVPVTASKALVDTVARKTFGMDGYVTSDCSGVEDIYRGHLYAEDGAEAAAMGLKAGVDTNCGRVYQIFTIEALEEGLITEAEIDKALVNIFTIRMRTGEFDPKPQVPYSDITPEVLNARAHAKLAEEVAEKTPVLLKNEIVTGTNRKALPLDISNLSRIALIGPQADRVELGPYSGRPIPSNMISPLEGIEALLKEKGADIEVVHNAGATTASLSNMYSIFSFELKRSDGSYDTVDATQFDTSSEGIEVAGGLMSAGRSLKQLKNGSWTSYSDINVSRADSIGISATVPGDGGRVEVRAGSQTGEILAEVEVTEGNPFNETTSYAELNLSGLSGEQDIYLVYRGPELPAINQEAVELAESSDVAIIFVGTDDRTTGEENDRVTLDLPGNQTELIKKVAAVNPNTIVIMQTLGMVEVEEFKNLRNIPGIIWTGFNGQAQGTAMARILFGDVNPGGKLNATWYTSLDNLPPITDYTLREGRNKTGRTYWYYKGDVSYEFGYGLSYTTFEYSNFEISQSEITPNDEFTVSVDVENTGDVDGDEIVQVYMATPDSPASLERPIKRLKGFKRVTIPSGQTKTVTIPIDASELWFWDGEQRKITFDQGRYLFEIGASSKDIRGEVETFMSGTFNNKLETVVAETRKVVLELDETVETSITASMSDDSFYIVEEALISYESSNPAVATVGENGEVTAKGAGTVTISAHVSVGEKTVTDSYPLKVMPNLNLSSLTVNGEEIDDFDTEVRGYSYLFSIGDTRVPQVNATAANPDNSVTVHQAMGVPGTAIVTVSNSATGQVEEYSVSFGVESESDEFNNEMLGDQWDWAREDRDNWSLSKSSGALTITAQTGDLKDDSNNAHNLLLQDANTDWTIESKVSYSKRPSKVDQQGGLIAYEDDDNYVKLVYSFASKGFVGLYEFVELIYEVDGAQFSAANVKTADLVSDNPELVLKLEKEGTIYRAYYSTDEGENFHFLGSTDAVLSNVKTGLIACDGDASLGGFNYMFTGQQREEEPPFEVSYDYFRIDNSGL